MHTCTHAHMHKNKHTLQHTQVIGSDVAERYGFKMNPREVYVVDRDASSGHSSTQVRKALRGGDCSYLEKALPDDVREFLLSAKHVQTQVGGEAVQSEQTPPSF